MKDVRCDITLHPTIHLPTHPSLLSHVWLFVTPWTVARQAPLSMGLPRQVHWRGLTFPSPGDLPDPNSCLLHWQVGSLPAEPTGEHFCLGCALKMDLSQSIWNSQFNQQPSWIYDLLLDPVLCDSRCLLWLLLLYWLRFHWSEGPGGDGSGTRRL